uniref:Uncharacterized protein n=1 Tax=Plectus sambesii TaxID=2011161 RepID=A0A914WSV6_9BILA
MRALPLIMILMCLIAIKQCNAFGEAIFGRYFPQAIEEDAEYVLRDDAMPRPAFIGEPFALKSRMTRLRSLARKIQQFCRMYRRPDCEDMGVASLRTQFFNQDKRSGTPPPSERFRLGVSNACASLNRDMTAIAAVFALFLLVTTTTTTTQGFMFRPTFDRVMHMKFSSNGARGPDLPYQRSQLGDADFFEQAQAERNRQLLSINERRCFLFPRHCFRSVRG